MAKFKPYKVLENQLNELPIKEGQFIVTSDTNQIYIDIDSATRKLYGENEFDTLFYTIESNSTEETRLAEFNKLNNSNKKFGIFLKYGDDFYAIDKGSLFNNTSYYTVDAINTYNITNDVGEFEYGHRLLNITKDSNGVINDVYGTMADVFRSIDSNSKSNFSYFKPTYASQPISKGYLNEVLPDIPTYFWDGLSDTENPNNLSLWQTIYNASRTKIVQVVATTGQEEKTNIFVIDNKRLPMSGNTEILGFVKGTIENIHGSKGEAIEFVKPACKIVTSDGTVTKVIGIFENRQVSAHFLPTDNQNVSNYEPTYDYHPATKKYVDDNKQVLIPITSQEIDEIWNNN